MPYQSASPLRPRTDSGRHSTSTAENLAETVPPASRFCRAAAPDGDIGNENGEPRAPMGPARVAHNARDGIDWPACAQRAATATDGIDGWRSSQQWNSSTAGWGKERCCKSRPQIGPFSEMLVRIAYHFGGAPDENCG